MIWVLVEEMFSMTVSVLPETPENVFFFLALSSVVENVASARMQITQASWSGSREMCGICRGAR